MSKDMGASAKADRATAAGAVEPVVSSKASIPSADFDAHLQAIAEERLWDDEISDLIEWGFDTVSRHPSDHEVCVAYRRVIASVLHHTRNGWRWEHGSFMGRRGWMWRRSATHREAAQ